MTTTTHPANRSTPCTSSPGSGGAPPPVGSGRARPRPGRRRLLALALLGGLALGAASCGGDGEAAAGDLPSLSGAQDGDGAGRGGTDGSGGDDEPPTEAERRALLVEHARCMRDHGIDMPDPQFEGSTPGAVMVPMGGGGPGDATFDDAQEACGPLLEEAMGAFEPPSAEEQAEQREQMLAFARCMREQGVDYPDPVFEGGRTIIRPGGDGSADGEALRQASETCQAQVGGGGVFAVSTETAR